MRGILEDLALPRAENKEERGIRVNQALSDIKRKILKGVLSEGELFGIIDIKLRNEIKSYKWLDKVSKGLAHSIHKAQVKKIDKNIEN